MLYGVRKPKKLGLRRVQSIKKCVAETAKLFEGCFGFSFSPQSALAHHLMSLFLV